jgi:UDP-N-acetylmuramoyl-tripeptide--D-alanyl-D-alanine ligase
MEDKIFEIIAIAVFFLATIVLLKEELHRMQLNSYFNSRYLKWLKDNLITNFRGHALILIIALILLIFGRTLNFDSAPLYKGLAYFIFGIAIGVSILLSIRVLRRKAKKKLDFTKRAVRLFVTAIILLAIVNGLILWLFGLRCAIISLLFSEALVAVLIIVANIVIKPVELAINQWFINDAKKKIDSFQNLIKIGITGSYGKTSVKHFVHAILSEKYNALMTPGSFNTTLGVVRTIREFLLPVHEVFVVEMGAKHIGDVKEICDIVKPRYGILTAIGPQHLESFGSLENIIKAKLEVITGLPDDGIGFVNVDNISTAEIPTDVKARIVTFAVANQADYMAENVVYRGRGMTFDIIYRGGKILSVETGLLGAHNVSNLLAACAVALELGVEKYRIEKAIRGIEAVQHRLEVKKTPGGITIIDDAFNSNPVGSKMALEALNRFEGKRKFVITPGMIELGAKEYELNREFGRSIAKNCDFAVLVGKNRTLPIQEGIREAGFPEENLFVCRDLNEANECVKARIQPGDVVLYENDLPDTFNE